MSEHALTNRRKNLEDACLTEFEAVLRDLGLPFSGRGYGADNRFDPGFGLVGQQRFQFGDLQTELPDRIVVDEVESGGGTTNLVKYWPLVERLDRPLLLLHGFGQGSANDYVSHQSLWDCLWQRMRADFSAAGNPWLHACRFLYKPEDGGARNGRQRSFEIA